MGKEIQKSYKFATASASLISLVMLGLALLLQAIYIEVYIGPSILFFVLAWVTTFLLIQLRLESYIFKRVKEVYDKVELIESSAIKSPRITTDMNTLIQELEHFAEVKKLEIETLKDRENYRKEFMGNISHELKTPLFTVQGYILTLLDGAINDKKVREKYLQRASKGVDRLVYIVKDLDLITRLEMEDIQLEKQDFNLVALIQNVFDLLEMKAHKKDISFTFDTDYNTPIYVHANKDKIQQVLINLFVNSIKYGKHGGTTEVAIEPLVKNKLIVRITDNGEGIQKENLNRIFERFYRIDKSGSRKEGGAGLGLAIVKHILEAHQESIYVESDFGTGSEFSFTLEKSKTKL